jgi:menaquinone-dependent protoporphyrinogen oxidase
MAHILIMYSSTDGQTLKICQRLQQVIAQQNHQVTLVSVTDAGNVDIKPFDKIVIGASIRYGRHSPQVYDFIKTNQKILDSKPSAFFSVNVVARKPAKNTPETNPYMKKFRKKTAWHANELAVFAGKIDYQKYSFSDRHLIRFIMWLTKGPTQLNTNIEFTDWEAVAAFGQRICVM